MLESLMTAVVGGLVVLAGERARGRWEDRRRWLPDRRSAYAKFLAAIDEWDRLDYDAALNGEVEEWFDAPPEDWRDPRVVAPATQRLRPWANAARSDAFGCLTDVELVGTTAVTVAARALAEELGRASMVRMQSPPRHCGGASDELIAAEDALGAARRTFTAAVRKDLGTDQ